MKPLKEIYEAIDNFSKDTEEIVIVSEIFYMQLSDLPEVVVRVILIPGDCAPANQRVFRLRPVYTQQIGSIKIRIISKQVYPIYETPKRNI